MITMVECGHHYAKGLYFKFVSPERVVVLYKFRTNSNFSQILRFGKHRLGSEFGDPVLRRVYQLPHLLDTLQHISAFHLLMAHSLLLASEAVSTLQNKTGEY